MMLLLFFLVLLHFRYYKRFSGLLLSLLILTFVFLTGIINLSTNKKDRLCVFNIKGLTALDISSGPAHYFVCTDTTHRMNDITYAVSGYWQRFFLAEPEFLMLNRDQKMPENFFSLPGENNYFATISGKKIIMISDLNFIEDYFSGMRAEIDLLVLGRNGFSPGTWSKLLDYIDPEYLVLDSSIPYYYPDPEIPDSFTGKIHRVSKNGAFMLDL
jgi:hypothetical protein